MATRRNDNSKMLYQWSFSLTFLFFLYLPSGQNTSNTQQQQQQLLDYRYACLDQSPVTTSSTYQANLNSLFNSLTSDSATSNGFGNRTSGTDENNRVYGLYLCRGDTNNSLCHSCVRNSTRLIKQLCPSNASALLFYRFCLLRYSSQDFFGNLTLTPRIPMIDPRQNFTSVGEFDSDARVLMNGLIQIGSEAKLMFGTHMFNINGTQRRYGWVQCSRDITTEGCRACLSNMLEEVDDCCKGRRVWRIISPSCIVMYETQPFFLTDLLPHSPTPQPGSEEGSNKRLLTIIISIICGIVVVLLLAFTVYYWCIKRTTRAMQDGLNPTFSQSLNENQDSVHADLPMMRLSTVQQTTANFSEEYKLGEGGFGPVYKKRKLFQGILPDGRQIAIKRLSKTSSQGFEEFKNEVILIAKLQHRNLVRLLAYCIEQNEKLLVYEYMPNSSLDFHLFDKEKRVQLDCKLRLSIVNGIAKGILYLHEDSRLRIIHRDLKASNILLDHDMNPKISDFGLARSFEGDQRYANTRRTVGTYGYMAPEYAMEGLFSIKSDVFSFGVLLLEIISGKRNSRFYHSELGVTLLIFAWRLWCEGKGLELMDPLLENSCSAVEVLKCIHIGLLCVQEDAADRPTMSTVVHMLGSDTMRLPKPKQPAFSVGRLVREQDSSSTNSTYCSNNEMTISELGPR